ncbi:extracellular substrate binding-like orphan protein GrrP [Crocosphaera sp.]|uniref:extracellular substrate binding-like orphan protein GrrP n=1 Tax=Crocosphaera sp. TaxID=2729996 RepID=UPI002621E7EF|nr:extracellular substrate binding-like orphan protein GrrP [Crocosphaera sp.]MDJ0583038.1 extracellular substrate binding-like orphan protein GrrP [Crocosphaera sp.]
MYKRLPLIALSLMAALAFPGQILAETVVERVARTGVLTVSTRVNLVPFAYVDDEDKLTGYSIEVIELIRETLEEELGKDVKIKVVVDDTLDERIVSVLNREVDIACDTTFTWQRDKFVDFSLAYGVSGIKVLVNENSNLSSPDSFKDKRIAIVENILRPDAIKVIESQVTVVTVDSIEAGIKALEDGEVDGFAFDGTILEGMRQTLDEPDDYKVIPEQAYFRHGIACMVPQQDSTFLNLVNLSIAKMMDGYINGDPRYTEIVNRYFGEDGIVPIEPQRIKDFFEMIIITREQVPPEE